MTVVVDLEKIGPARRRTLAHDVAAHPGVATVTPATTSPDGAVAIFTAEPDYGPADERIAGLVTRLRADVLPDGAELTGRRRCSRTSPSCSPSASGS